MVFEKVVLSVEMSDVWEGVGLLNVLLVVLDETKDLSLESYNTHKLFLYLQLEN